MHVMLLNGLLMAATCHAFDESFVFSTESVKAMQWLIWLEVGVLLQKPKFSV
jgi:hypothetical protein